MILVRADQARSIKSAAEEMNNIYKKPLLLKSGGIFLQKKQIKPCGKISQSPFDTMLTKN